MKKLLRGIGYGGLVTVILLYVFTMFCFLVNERPNPHTIVGVVMFSGLFGVWFGVLGYRGDLTA